MAVFERLVAGFALLCFALVEPAAAASCGAKHTCGEMADCAEAVHYLRDCGLHRLDADSDGIPCETMCGKSRETLERRIDTQSRQRRLPPTYACGAKRTCGEMDSCAEARFHLQTCRRRSLDGDGDGVPCEGLCH